MRRLCIVLSLLLPTSVLADDFAVEAAAHASFPDLPKVQRLQDIADQCGASGQANRDAVYCTSRNLIYLRIGATHLEYKLAHVMGHAVQVRHGIADIALRQITQRRSEEAALRSMVTRQVECIAGFLLARAGIDLIDLSAAFINEPFTGSHWGRNPLRVGPKVSIGTEARKAWLGEGYGAATPKACAVEEIGSELLMKAYTP